MYYPLPNTTDQWSSEYFPHQPARSQLTNQRVAMVSFADPGLNRICGSQDTAANRKQIFRQALYAWIFRAMLSAGQSFYALQVHVKKVNTDRFSTMQVLISLITFNSASSSTAVITHNETRNTPQER